MTAAVDLDKLKLYSFGLFSKLEGAVTVGMVHLGDRLGLYRSLAAATGPVSSAQLAEATDLDERWVREWLHNQGAARLVDFAVDDHGNESFWLSPEATAVLTDDHHPAFGMGMFHRLPQTMAMLDPLQECFRTGMGYDYDAFGPEGAVGIERSFAPWYKNFLVPVALPMLEGVTERLQAGGVAADVGCGSGTAVLTLAEAFPSSQVHGYDISLHALARADEKKEAQGITNAYFHDARVSPLPEDGSVDLVTTFDCIHDMTHPMEAIRSIRRAVKPDGTWLLVDIKARDTFADNVEKNPMAAMMYGISVLSCMSSALSHPDGAGLGTLGLPASKAEEMAREAGFTRFRKLAIDHAVNVFYEVRP